jgi:hypothetical protein
MVALPSVSKRLSMPLLQILNVIRGSSLALEGLGDDGGGLLALGHQSLVEGL